MINVELLLTGVLWTCILKIYPSWTGVSILRSCIKILWWFQQNQVKSGASAGVVITQTSNSPQTLILIALPGVKFSKKVKSNRTRTFWPNWDDDDDDDIWNLNDHGWLFAMFECWVGRAHDSQSANRLTNNYITHPTNTADPLRRTQWKTNRNRHRTQTFKHNRLTNNYITHPTNTAAPLRRTQWKTNTNTTENNEIQIQIDTEHKSLNTTG